MPTGEATALMRVSAWEVTFGDVISTASPASSPEYESLKRLPNPES